MRLAAIGFNLSTLANPVVLIEAAAVAAVVGAGLVVRKDWEPIKAFFGGVGQALGKAFDPALSAIGSMLAPLKPLWDGFADGVGKVAGWFGRLLTPVDAADKSVTSAAEAGRKFGRVLAIGFKLSPVGLFVGHPHGHPQYSGGPGVAAHGHEPGRMVRPDGFLRRPSGAVQRLGADDLSEPDQRHPLHDRQREKRGYGDGQFRRGRGASRGLASGRRRGSSWVWAATPSRA